ncbi:MAG: hypothetical protein Q9165_002828 [Trypethelium subeluteriae]
MPKAAESSVQATYWDIAFQHLPRETSEKLQKLIDLADSDDQVDSDDQIICEDETDFNANADAEFLPSQLLKLCRRAKREYDKKQWKIYFRRKEIVLHELWNDAIDVLKRVEELGDAVVGLDQKADLGWSIAKAFFRIPIQKAENAASLADGLGKAIIVMGRGRAYEHQLCNSKPALDTPNIKNYERFLVKMYGRILLFYTSACRDSRGGPRRSIWSSVWERDAIKSFIRDANQIQKDMQAETATILQIGIQSDMGAIFQGLDPPKSLLGNRPRNLILNGPKSFVRYRLKNLIKNRPGEHLAVLKWLSNLPWDEYHRSARDGRTATTGTWIFRRKEYETLTKQLASSCGVLTPEIIDTHRRKGPDAGNESLSIEDCREMLESIIDVSEEVFLIIDALDECSEESKRSLLDVFDFLIQSHLQVKIIVSSREEPELSRLGQSANLRISATDNQDDIPKFVRQRIREFKAKTQDDTREWPRVPPYMEEEIIRTFKEKSQRINANEIRNALTVLPTNLTDVYSEVFNLIDRKPDGLRDLAIRAFAWLQAAGGSCKMSVLVAAASQRPKGRDGINRIMQEAADVLQVCQNLLVIEDDTVRFSHVSIQDHFEGHRPEARDCHILAAKICLRTVIDHDPQTHISSPKLKDLWDYAYRNWTQHIICAPTDSGLKDILDEFLTPCPPSPGCARWLSQIATDMVQLMVTERHLGSPKRFWLSPIVFRPSSWLGWEIIPNNDDILNTEAREVEDLVSFLDQVTWAVYKNNVLYSHNGKLGTDKQTAHTYSDPRDRERWNFDGLLPVFQYYKTAPPQYLDELARATLLLLCMKRLSLTGSERQLVDHLFSVFDLSHSLDYQYLRISKFDLRPLLVTVDHLYEPRIVEFLVSHGADVNFTAEDEAVGSFGTVLIAAIGKGKDQSARIVEFLLKLPNLQDVNGLARVGDFGTALITACVSGKQDVVEILLKHPDINVDVEASTGEYGTALIAACAINDITIVKMLLGKHANVGLHTTQGKHATALTAALDCGSNRLVSLLLDEAAPVDEHLKNAIPQDLVEAKRRWECFSYHVFTPVVTKHEDINERALMVEQCGWVTRQLNIALIYAQLGVDMEWAARYKEEAILCLSRFSRCSCTDFRAASTFVQSLGFEEPTQPTLRIWRDRLASSGKAMQAALTDVPHGRIEAIEESWKNFADSFISLIKALEKDEVDWEGVTSGCEDVEADDGAWLLEDPGDEVDDDSDHGLEDSESDADGFEDQTT